MQGNLSITRLAWLIPLLVLSLAGTWCAFAAGRGPAMVVSVSSDGHYAVSSHQDNAIVLWDLEQQTHTTISRHGNIYSAYFVKGRDVFLWQDLDNVVHVQQVDGTTVEQFKNFPTYGHVMGRDLEQYAAASAEYHIVSGHGPNQVNVQTGDGGSFEGFGKLYNLTLSKDSRFLLSAGFGPLGGSDLPATKAELKTSNYVGVILWSAQTGQPIAKLPGNAAQTYATLTPDGQRVLSGDVGGLGFLWSVEQPGGPLAKFRLGPAQLRSDTLPDGFQAGTHYQIQTIQFVSDNRYIVFFHDRPYAFLYDLSAATNPDSNFQQKKAIKYFDLSDRPQPSVARFVRNAAFDTAPAAGLLVTGQDTGGGINVYQYDDSQQTLTRIWAPD